MTIIILTIQTRRSSTKLPNHTFHGEKQHFLEKFIFQKNLEKNKNVVNIFKSDCEYIPNSKHTILAFLTRSKCSFFNIYHSTLFWNYDI